MWCQLSVHVIHKWNTGGERQGLACIVGNVNGSYFSRLKLNPCNGFQALLFSGPHSVFSLFTMSNLFSLAPWVPCALTRLPTQELAPAGLLPRVLFPDVHVITLASCSRHNCSDITKIKYTWKPILNWNCSHLEHCGPS